jgi:acetolactate synthase I/II/III large subunit
MRPTADARTTTMETMTGAEMVIRALQDQWVEQVFGYPGGAVLPIYDALFHQEKIRHILVRHEQGAVHAAEGFARSSGKTGVVLVTSGPGATNAVTGLTDALMDSIPLVCITGQVPTHLIGSDAFQECDTVGITRHCTKHNYLVKTIEDLPRILHEAFYVAGNGRPGPVVIDLPKDIQFKTGLYARPRNNQHKTYRPAVKGDIAKIKAAVELMSKAKRPVFYTGGGVINSGPHAAALLREIVRLTGFPITSTLMGLGAFPASDPQFLGMLGMHGTYEANLAMFECDLMINIGARFDDRITGRLDGFSPNSKKIHVDIDPSSINKTVTTELGIVGDCAHVLEDLVRLWRSSAAQVDKPALNAWWERIAGWRARNCLAYRPSSDAIRAAPLRADQGPRHVRDDRGRPAPDVGRAILQVRGAEPLDDLRRARHHGLRPSGGDRRAARASEVARNRHRRGGIGPDDDAGDVDRRAVPAADQGVHPQQPIHGDGASVAGASARRTLLGELFGLAA